LRLSEGVWQHVEDREKSPFEKIVIPELDDGHFQIPALEVVDF